MSDVDPRLRRVIVDVEPEHFVALLTVLGDFAMGCDATVRICASPANITDPSIDPRNAEKPRYNPDLMAWATDEESGEPVAIITAYHLTRFETTDPVYVAAGRARRAVKFMNSLFWHNKKNEYRGSLDPYLYTIAGVWGIRGDRIKRLVQLLRADAPHVHGIGGGTLDFLEAFCKKLFAEEPGNPDSAQ